MVEGNISGVVADGISKRGHYLYREFVRINYCDLWIVGESILNSPPCIRKAAELFARERTNTSLLVGTAAPALDHSIVIGPVLRTELLGSLHSRNGPRRN